MPGESLVSILWKFACANALPSHALLDLISPEVDPHEGVAPVRDVVDLTRLRRVLRLPSDVLRTSLLSAAPHVLPTVRSARLPQRAVSAGG